MDIDSTTNLNLTTYQSMIAHICSYSCYNLIDLANYLQQPLSALEDIQSGKKLSISLDAEIKLIKLYNLCMRSHSEVNTDV